MSDLSLIIPTFQKQPIILESLTEKLRILELMNINYDMIVVVDGDNDNTINTIQSFVRMYSKVKVVAHKQNKGKGSAIKSGIANSTGDYIGFIDADMDIDPVVIQSMYSQIKQNGADMIVANKYHPKSTRKTTFLRQILSKIFAIGIHWLFGFSILDTQTGAKIMKNKFAKEILMYSKLNGFGFDVELFKYAQKMNYKVIDAPICIRTISPSTLNVRNQIRTICEICSIL